MAVFHLEESEIVSVQEMMDEIKTEVEEILSQPVSFKGLGNFNKKVIFVQEYFSNPRALSWLSTAYDMLHKKWLFYTKRLEK